MTIQTNVPDMGSSGFTPTTLPAGSIVFSNGTQLTGNVSALSWDNTNLVLKADNAQFKGNPWFDVRSYGAVGDGTTDDTTAIQAAITAAISAGKSVVYVTKGTYKTTAALTITNAINLRITGPGKIAMAAAADYAFKLVGTCAFIEIDHLTLQGTGSSADNQTGIGNASGQTISDIHFHDLSILDVCVGISLNADTGGTYKRGTVQDNILSNLVGTTAGKGYGIHVANAEEMVISANVIRTAQRHSLYHAKGLNNILANNIIIDHRSGVSSGANLAAISVARTSAVRVQGNLVVDFYDGGLEVAGIAADPSAVSDTLIQENTFYNPKNAVACIFVGEDAVQSAVTIRDLHIQDNLMYVDASLMSAFSVVNIYFGLGVKVNGNVIRIANLNATAHVGIKVGNGTYISNSTYCDDLQIRDNFFYFTGTSAASAQAVRVDSVLCGNNGVHLDIAGNQYASLRGAAALNYTAITLEAANANPLLRYNDHMTVVRGSAAPTSKYWVVGDVVLNDAPADDGAQGWICVTAGAPGTWDPLAPINTFQMSSGTLGILPSANQVAIGSTSSNGAFQIGTGQSSTFRNTLILDADAPRLYWETPNGKRNWKMSAQDSASDTLEISNGGTDTNATDDTYTPLVLMTITGVGIGGAPSTLLHLTSSSSPELRVQGGASGDVTVSLFQSATQRAFLQYLNSTSNLRLDSDGSVSIAPNNTEALFLNTSGQVGVGATPSALFHVTSTGSPEARVQGGSSSDVKISLFQASERAYIQYQNTGSVFRIDSDGLIRLAPNNSSAFDIDTNLTLIPKVTLATGMTTGFINVPGAAGVPSGTPATTTGFPLYYDSTNNKLRVYNAAWKIIPTYTQATGGENVTNNVTDTASTAGTIPDITNGTVYATDYTNLRNALFQLARMLKQDHDQLRAMGILS